MKIYLKKWKTLSFFVIFSMNMALSQNSMSYGEELKSLKNEVSYNKLNNGFSYYVKPNARSSGKIFLKLLVKTGSLQEDETQMDIAHAVEHMVTKGSINFPEGIQGDDQFADNGVSINNFTSGLKYAQYNLSVPTGNDEAFDTAMLLYSDIMNGVYLKDADINSERGVLRQEFVSRTGHNLDDFFLQSEIKNKLFPCRSDMGNFFDHNRNFRSEALRRFYKDWYRPDLMTLIVVGDIRDTKAIRNKIKQTFEKIPEKSNPRKPVKCDSVYFSQANKFINIKRSEDSLDQLEDSIIEIQLFFKDPKTKELISSSEGRKRIVIWQAITKCLNNRFAEKSANYLNSYNLLSRYSYEDHPSALKVQLKSEIRDEFATLNEMIKMLNQMKTYGLQADEWIQVKNELLDELNNTDVEGPVFWLNDIRNHEIYAQSLGKEKIEEQITWLTNLPMVQLNEKISNLIPAYPNDIVIFGSKESSLIKLSENQFRDKIKEAYNIPVQNYKAPFTPRLLMGDSITNNLIRKDYKLIKTGEYGEKVFELQNGIKIILKSFTPEPGRNQEKILFHGFKDFGASSFPEKDYFSAFNAPQIVKNAGVGDFDRFTLNRFLKNTSFWQGVQPYIKYNETGIKGSSSTKDFEKMLQLNYLYFTAPRQDKTAFTDWRKTQKSYYQNPKSDKVHSDLADAIALFLNDKSTDFRGYKALEGVDSTNMTKAYEIYAALYEDVKGFRFVITGNFDEEEIIPLAAKYIGNLPVKTNNSLNKREVNKENQLPDGPVFKDLEIPGSNSSTRYVTKFINNSEDVYDWKEEIRVNLLGLITNDKIKDLRYKYNFSLYQFGVTGKFENELWRYEIGVKINCIPSELEAIKKICDKIYKNIRKGKFEEKDIKLMKNRLSRYYNEKFLNRNSQMNQRLYENYRWHKDFPNSKEALSYIASLTKEDIMKTAAIYFQQVNRYEFVLVADKF